MSTVKLKCVKQHKWGNPLITGYGTFEVNDKGIVEVPKVLADKLLAIPNSYEEVKSAPKKSAPKKGDLNKDGKVDSKDLDIAKEEQKEAEEEKKEADEKVDDVLGDLTKKQLTDVAKDLKLKKAEYATLNKEDLKEYISQKS